VRTRPLIVLGSLAVALAVPACLRGVRPDAEVEREEPGARVLGEGVASYYAASLHGRPTASGEPYDRAGFTAAHRSLRLGTCLTVVNLENGRKARVRVNDRGPFAKERVLDLSEAAAEQLGLIGPGVARVRLLGCR